MLDDIFELEVPLEEDTSQIESLRKPARQAIGLINSAISSFIKRAEEAREFSNTRDHARHLSCNFSDNPNDSEGADNLNIDGDPHLFFCFR